MLTTCFHGKTSSEFLQRTILVCFICYCFFQTYVIGSKNNENSESIGHFSSNHLVVNCSNEKNIFNFIIWLYFFSYFRSPYVTREQRTLADKPEMPPNMTLGSFEAVSHDIQKRTIYVYWRQIPDYNQNGPNFRYSVTEVIIVPIQDLNLRLGILAIPVVVFSMEE